MPTQSIWPQQRHRYATGPALAAGALLAALLLGACQPRLAVEGGREPITININADIRLRVERMAEEDIRQNPDIF